MWPDWWDWPLELTPHLEMRGEERGFTEVDLRKMLEDAESLKHSVTDDRWIVLTSHAGRPWSVVVEPDRAESVLTVITAYPVSVPKK